MIGPPSLLSMIMLIDQRQAELEAQAARDWLGRQAQGDVNHRGLWGGLSAVVMVVVVVLVLAAGAVAAP
jgi:hypothetical protein